MYVPCKLCTEQVCCLVSSMCASQWLNLLTEDQVEVILRSIVIRILTGTRHKGAMEAARTCYSQLSTLLLSGNSKFGHLVHKQVCLFDFLAENNSCLALNLVLFFLEVGKGFFHNVFCIVFFYFFYHCEYDM